MPTRSPGCFCGVFFDPGFTWTTIAIFSVRRPIQASLLNTFKMSISVTLICLILGYPVAYLLANLPSRVSNLLMIMVVLPFFTAILVRTYAWMVILGRNGLINQFLMEWGFISSPLKLMHNLVWSLCRDGSHPPALHDPSDLQCDDRNR